MEIAVSFCRSKGITSISEMRRFRAQKFIDEPLWKPLELDGKYVQRFESRGVREIREICNDRPNSKGKWSRRTIDTLRSRGYFNGGLSEKDIHCRLDHVFPRKLLKESLLGGDIKPADIYRHLLGCVVLEKEHQRMKGKKETLVDPWRKYRESEPEVDVYDCIQKRYLDLNQNSPDSKMRSVIH